MKWGVCLILIILGSNFLLPTKWELQLKHPYFAYICIYLDVPKTITKHYVKIMVGGATHS